METLKAEVPQTHEEFTFNEKVQQVIPLLEEINDLLSNGRLRLKDQKYKIENNHRTIVDQEKKIAENVALMESARTQADAIIDAAGKKEKEVMDALNIRIAQANHIEREAKKLYAAAEKSDFNSRQAQEKGQ